MLKTVDLLYVIGVRDGGKSDRVKKGEMKKKEDASRVEIDCRENV